jgi:hypothetical protein
LFEFGARANVASLEETNQRVPHQGNTQIVFVHSLWRAYIMDVVPSFHVRPFRRLQSGFDLGVL